MARTENREGAGVNVETEPTETVISNNSAELAAALIAAGIELGEDQDPVQQAIAIVGRWKELTLARGELGALIIDKIPPFGAAAQEDPLAAAAQIVGSHEALLSSVGTLADYILAHNPEAVGDNGGACETAVKLLADADQTATDLAARIAQLEAALAADGKEIPDAAPAASLRGPEARPIKADAKRLNRDKLAELLKANGRLELVFSTGEHEIMEFEPIALKGVDLQRSGNGFMVRQPIVVKGSGHGQSVHGAALLSDGKQVSYCSFERPIHIPAGQSRQFSNAIRFD